MLKDLFKPGRKLNEYVNEDGTPKIDCISCGRRLSIKDNFPGNSLCGDDDRHERCNPRFNSQHDYKMDHLLWKPRVDYEKAGFIGKEDFNV